VFTNKTAFILMLVSLMPLGMSFYAVFISGELVKELPLRGKVGETNLVSVDPGMNPLRLLISVDYGGKAFSAVQRNITYQVTAYNEEKMPLWTEDGRVSSNSDSKVISDQTHHSSLQTFGIGAPQKIYFDYSIDSKNLRYKGGALTLNRNVIDHNWLITIAGLFMLVGGVLIIANNSRNLEQY
jgi:hypothetical protein